MRSIWKGSISFSLVNIPINVFSATESESTVSFNQFHKKDHGRVGYEKKCKECGQALTEEDIIKGYEVNKGNFVFFEPGELENLKIQSQNTIEIQGFVDVAEISPLFFEKPYYLAPQDDAGMKGYNLLVKTISKVGKLAVAKVSIRQKEDFVLISPMENVLVMYKIRYPAEIRSINELPRIKDIDVKKGEMDLAEKLIETMSVSINDIEVVDQYQLELRKLVESKMEGKTFVQPEVKASKTATPDLMSALKESLANSVSKKPMQKSTGTKKTKTTKTTKTAQRKQA
ncbi:MAG: Ku protein [Ignavibacteriaceae bacterium]